MALHKGLMTKGFKLPTCEKHFHDHDETWLILKGRGTSYWIDPEGNREEFELQAGDVWMIPAGYEHGTDGFSETGQNSDDFTISTFNGTQPPGCHKPGHYYVEEQGYLPSLKLLKTSTDRYNESIPKTMRRIVFSEQNKTELIEDETPICEPGTVLCKTIYTGLTNGTERNGLVGGNYGTAWPAYPGYQNVGRIVSAGDGVEEFSVGDIVFSGDHLKHMEYFKAPAQKDDLLIKLPETVNPKQAALFGMAGVAMHDVRSACVRLGEKVLVIGAGPVGQFTAQLARLSGAIVTICDLNEKRLVIASEIGTHKTITVTPEPQSWEAIKRDGPYDVVIEDSGAPILDTVFGIGWNQGILKQNSRVVMVAGRHRVDYHFNAGQSYELTVVHVSHFVHDDLQQVCRFTAEGLLKIDPIIQDEVKIDQAVAIYDKLRDNPTDLFGVVFDWT
jgi:2-desacetyl-2-hydroxyethyl bacteriochlorophyllide A dehydrogenase